MKLEVKHDTHTYNVPIDIIYKCLECLDRNRIVIGEFDNVEDVQCPFCTPERQDEDDDS